jgi:hypothetical protein
MGHFCRKADSVDAQIHKRIYNDRHSKRADNQRPLRDGRDVRSLLSILLRLRARIWNSNAGREAVRFTSHCAARDGFHCFRRAVRFNDDSACPCVYHRQRACGVGFCRTGGPICPDVAFGRRLACLRRRRGRRRRRRRGFGNWRRTGKRWRTAYCVTGRPRRLLSQGGRRQEN